MPEHPPGESPAAGPLVRRFDDRGANLVEYALLIALVVIACIGALSYFAGGTTDMFADVCEEVGSGTGTSDPECEE